MYKLAALFLLLLATVACEKTPLPKPPGELRLEYPQPVYKTFSSGCGYSFEYSDFAKMEPAKRSCWYYISYPAMKAKVFITYFPINNDLNLHVKEAEKMVYAHTIRATAIDTKSFAYPEKKLYGNFYELQGQTASNLQFYATDSTRHFVTGNVYFNSRPKPDSLAPAVAYIKADLKHLLDTFEWKN